MVVLPVGEKMVCFFGNGKWLIVDFWCFIAAVSFSGIELSVENEHLKSCVFVQEDQTRVLACETSPNYAVKFEISDESVNYLLLIVQSYFIFQGYQQ